MQLQIKGLNTPMQLQIKGLNTPMQLQIKGLNTPMQLQIKGLKIPSVAVTCHMQHFRADIKRLKVIKLQS